MSMQRDLTYYTEEVVLEDGLEKWRKQKEL